MIPTQSYRTMRKKISKRQNLSNNSNRMNPKKGSVNKKKRRRNNKKHIKTLFEAIRKESQLSLSDFSVQSSSTILGDTVIEVNNTNKTSSEIYNQASKSPKSSNNYSKAGSSSNSSPKSVPSPKKRKANGNKTESPKRQKRNPSLVIIDEDELEIPPKPETTILPSKYKNLDDSVQFVMETNSNKLNVENVPNTPLVGKLKFKQNPLNINCSTPIHKNEKTNLQELIISNFPNNNSILSRNFNEEVNSLTREINRDSYITIDLTEGNTNNSVKDETRDETTVIDLANVTDDNDCAVVSVKSLSMSGDSDVTVVNMSQRKREAKVHKYINRIANLDSSGRVLETVMNKIFDGCRMVRNAAAINNGDNMRRQPDTAENAFIKEVILGQSCSRNSIGSNIYNPERDAKKTGLRMVVVDGSNVAMQHGKGKVFSVKGLKICIDYFLKRGHVVKAFVPRFRCKFGKSSDPKLLDDLERQGLVVYTPSREIQGRFIMSYDDRYIVQCAAEFDGVIVSGDNYRDLERENPRWRFVIENRLLPFTWVHDMIMFPKDPLGRNGPTLDTFLKHTQNNLQKKISVIIS